MLSISILLSLLSLFSIFINEKLSKTFSFSTNFPISFGFSKGSKISEIIVLQKLLLSDIDVLFSESEILNFDCLFNFSYFSNNNISSSNSLSSLK